MARVPTILAGQLGGRYCIYICLYISIYLFVSLNILP